MAVLKLLMLLLIVWVLFAVLGFIIKGLIWLAIIGIILFVVTSLFGWMKRGRSRE